MYVNCDLCSYSNLFQRIVMLLRVLVQFEAILVYLKELPLNMTEDNLFLGNNHILSKTKVVNVTFAVLFSFFSVFSFHFITTLLNLE